MLCFVGQGWAMLLRGRPYGRPSGARLGHALPSEAVIQNGSVGIRSDPKWITLAIPYLPSGVRLGYAFALNHGHSMLPSEAGRQIHGEE